MAREWGGCADRWRGEGAGGFFWGGGEGNGGG